MSKNGDDDEDDGDDAGKIYATYNGIILSTRAHLASAIDSRHGLAARVCDFYFRAFHAQKRFNASR